MHFAGQGVCNGAIFDGKTGTWTCIRCNSIQDGVNYFCADGIIIGRGMIMKVLIVTFLIRDTSLKVFDGSIDCKRRVVLWFIIQKSIQI